MKKGSNKIWYLCVAGFRLLCLPVAGEIVQSAILHQSSKGEDEADRDKKVHGGDVGNLWQGLPGDGTESRHGKHCGDA